MNVLITAMFEPAALTAIRRFGEMGFKVAAADGHRLAFGLYSKYVSRRVRLPSLRIHPQAYTEALLRELETGRYDYYFPALEEIIPLSRSRERLLAATKSVIPDFEKIMTLHDKTKLAELAKTLDIDTPETFVPHSREEVLDFIQTIDYPIVIKQQKTSGAAGFRIIREPDPKRIAKQYFDVVKVNRLGEGQLPMIQRFVVGPTICSLELANQGEVLGELMIRGIRTMPRMSGTTVYRETVSSPACEEASRRIIRHLNWSGFCGFDYIMDEETGRPFLVDGNPRTTPSINLAHRAGCDMIAAWVQLADGETTSSLPRWKDGVRSRLQFADFIWLLESYMGSFKNWSEEHRLRKGWWRTKGCYYDIASLKDPMPNIMVWVYILANLYKLVFTDFDPAQLFVFYDQYVENSTSDHTVV